MVRSTGEPDRATWYALRAFAAGLACASLLAFMWIAPDALRSGSVLLAIASLGLVLLAGLGAWGYARLRGDPWGRQSWLRKEATARVDLPAEDAVALCLEAMADLGACAIDIRLERAEIHARLPGSWTTLGGRIEARVVASSGKSCQVHLTSDSSWPSALWEFGRNERNVGFVLQRLCEGASG